MTETNPPDAYWTSQSISAPEDWQVQLLQHSEGRLVFRVFSNVTQILDSAEAEVRKILITYQDPATQIVDFLQMGSSLPEALADWRSQTEELLHVKESAPHKVFLAANSLVRSDPNTVLNALDLRVTLYAPAFRFADSQTQSRDFRLVTLALGYEPWAETISRLNKLSVAQPPVSQECNEIESLEQVRAQGERASMLSRKNMELTEQNVALLKQLHSTEKALISAETANMDDGAISGSNQEVASRQTNQLRVAEEQVQTLRAELEKERGRIVKFKTKIRQLRELLHQPGPPAGPEGTTSSGADNANR